MFTIFNKFNRLFSTSVQNVRSLNTSNMRMGAFDAEFSKAKDRLNALKEDPGNEVKLQIYALFKQVCLLYVCQNPTVNLNKFLTLCLVLAERPSGSHS